MTRKALIILSVCLATLFSCQTKESHTEESTEHLDNYYENNEDETLEAVKSENSQDEIDQTTGIFNIAEKVIEFKAIPEASFNDVCFPGLKYMQSPICKNINDFEKCCMAFESVLISKANAPVKREGNQLEIKLKNGKTKNLANKVHNQNDGAEEYLAFVFSEYFPSLNVIAVDQFFYEGGQTVLIDLETGTETIVMGDVNISPDGKKLVSFSCDLMAGFRSNGIQVIERNPENKKLSIVLSFEISKFGPEYVCWQNNEQLIVKQLSMNDNYEPVYSYATLRLLQAL